MHESNFSLCTTMDVDVQRDSSANAPVPFEGLWFPDGNIILATDMYLFKVHRGILSLQSSVFRDMLELPVVDGEQSNRNDAGMARKCTRDYRW